MARACHEAEPVAFDVVDHAVEHLEFKLAAVAAAGIDLADRQTAAKPAQACGPQARRQGIKLPEGTPTSLDVGLIADTPPSAFPNGCHVAEVELDPDTGVIEVVKYSMVNDFGTIINPITVAGQAHGGVMQGIGQALLERTYYDNDGQLLSGSFMDYAMPRADNAPSFKIDNHPVPAKTNELGAKGCGEAGCAGSLPAVMNAVHDALAAFGVKHIDMPATPEKVWRAIHDARAA
jgi:carbon-monoxide dehydrogenase large subunit